MHRMLSLALSVVQRQQILLKSSLVDTVSLQEDLDSLTHLADGDKGVAWADQTRVSTNDLQDVNISTFSLTQQQLFNCFLEHSSPRLRRGLRRDSPQLFPSSLSILTSTSARAREEGKPRGKESCDRTVTPACSSSSLEECDVTTPTSRTNTGTVTVRASHIISSRTSPHRNTKSAPGGGGSVTVTTDVCISSSSDLTECDDLSDVSSSGVGSYSTTSEPLQCNVDYDKLEKKATPKSATLTKGGGPRNPAFNVSSAPPTSAMPTSLYGSVARLGGGSFHSTRRLDRAGVGVAGPTPQPYSMFQPFHSGPTRRAISSTQMFSPPCSRPSLSSLHSISTDSGIGHVTALPRRSPPTPTTYGAGGHVNNHMTSSRMFPGPPRAVTGIERNRGGLLIPNRPMANGFMVRSSPSASSGYYSNSHYYTTTTNNGFEDNFVSPPQPPQPPQLWTHTPSDGHMAVKSPDSHMTRLMKAPIGAFKSPSFVAVPSPFPARVTATPNPYVKAPSHVPRPQIPVSTRRPSHEYQSITIPGPTHNPGSTSKCEKQQEDEEQTCMRSLTNKTATSEDQRISLSKCTAVDEGSKCRQNDAGENGHALNATFTVDMVVTKKDSSGPLTSVPVGNGYGCDQKSGTSGGAHGEKGNKKGLGQGRGSIFSRNKSPSKLPSYLKMTKSAESKKVNR